MFVSAVHSAVVGDITDSEDDRKRAVDMLKEFVEVSKNAAHPLDVVTFVLNNEPFREGAMNFAARSDYIAARVMVHDCRPDYCYKTKAQQQDKRCRFGERPICLTSLVQLEFRGKSGYPTVVVTPRRNHPDIIGFNRVMLATWCANCDFKLVFDSDKVIQYILKYTLKKDVAKVEMDAIMKFANGSNSEIKCSPQASRLAERLKRGEFRNLTQVVSSMVNLSSSTREVGAPELCMILLSQPLVRFRNIKFVYIPASLDGARIESDESHQGVLLNKNSWAQYNARCTLALDPAQTILRTVNDDALRDMSAAEFFGRFYVAKLGIVKEHDGSNRVTIWPFWSDCWQHNPQNANYFKWAKWFLLRFLPFHVDGNAINDFLTMYFLPKAKGYAPTFIDDLTLPEDLKDESNPVVQMTIVRIFNVLIEHDPKARSVYNDTIVKYSTVLRNTAELRNGIVEDGGVHNHADRGTGQDVPLNPVVANVEHAQIDEHFAGEIPSSAFAKMKRDLLPECLRELHPQTLDRLAESAKNHLTTLPVVNQSFREQPVRELSSEQEKALEMALAKSGEGGAIFVHGGPGTGKSNLIKHYVNRERSLTITTATTGKAAVLIGGDTVHGVFCLNTAHDLSDDQKLRIQNTLQNVTSIIVDEVSMLGTELATSLNSVLCQFPRLPGKEWGGYRMFFSGDFAQCPPVRCGRPFHQFVGFGQCEVALLNQSHRTTDTVSIEMLRKIRHREMDHASAETLRRMCCPQYNPERVHSFAADWTIFELVTTNQEVDNINERYVKEFSAFHRRLIGRVVPRSGAELLFAEGVRLCVLKNIRKDYAITNGLFVTCVCALFPNNEQPEISPGLNPDCILVSPDRIDDIVVNTGWHLEVKRILDNGGMIIDGDGSVRALLESEVNRIVQFMNGVVPVAHTSSFADREGSDKQKWVSSIPLRLAKAVTIHKLQGSSLEKLIMTPGTRKMFGTTYTGLSRAKGGLSQILLAGHYSDEYLVDDVNADPPPDYDIVEVSQRLEAMALETGRRHLKGQLYRAPVISPIVDVVDVTFTRSGQRRDGSRGGRRAGNTRGRSASNRGGSNRGGRAGVNNIRGRGSVVPGRSGHTVPQPPQQPDTVTNGTRARGARGRGRGRGHGRANSRGYSRGRRRT